MKDIRLIGGYAVRHIGLHRVTLPKVETHTADAGIVNSILVLQCVRLHCLNYHDLGLSSLATQCKLLCQYCEPTFREFQKKKKKGSLVFTEHKSYFLLWCTKCMHTYACTHARTRTHMHTHTHTHRRVMLSWF